jgi:hypothetical protein
MVSGSNSTAAANSKRQKITSQYIDNNSPKATSWNIVSIKYTSENGQNKCDPIN